MNRVKRWWIIFPICIGCFLVCDKHGEKDKPEPTSYDVKPIEVEIPDAEWEKIVAVLPLRAAASDEAAAFRMMSEQIVSVLSRSPHLKIVRVPSVSWLVETGVEADYVLSGQILGGEESLKIHFQLVDTETDSILWTEKVEEDSESMLIISEEASTEIQGHLGSSTYETQTEAQFSSETMRSYFKARDLLARERRSDTDLAIQGFKVILRNNSTFTLAHVGLAECYLQIFEKGWDRNIVWLRLAQEACLKALQEEDIPEARVALGRTHFLKGDLKHAEEAFRLALQINTNQIEAWTGLARILIGYGLYESCLEVYNIVLGMDPGDSEVAMSRALILVGLTRYGEARETLERIISLRPGEHHLHSIMALTLYYEGKTRQAKDEIRAGLKSDILSPFSHAVLAMIHAREKKFDDALGELELEVKPYAGNDASLATAVAAVHTLLGQNGTAIEWLEKAIGWGYKEYPWLMSDSNFIGLRDDERYIQLMDSLRRQWEDRRARYRNP